MINFFETVKVTLNRDVDVSDEFFPIDKHLFIHTNVFKDSDRDGSHTIHAHLQETDFTLPPNMKFVKPMKPMPGKVGIFKY